MKKNKKLSVLLLLHLLLVVYSSSGIFSKIAANQSFLSWKFCLCYGMVIVLLGVYAIGWQQIIKHIPLTTAFANKAITIVWNLIWGRIFFQESITFGKLFGTALVVGGVILYVTGEEEVLDE